MDSISNMPAELKRNCGLEMMFDQYRVVDPVNNQVMALDENNSLIFTGDVCHDIWGRGERCKNCISLRCIDERHTIIKLEYTEDTMFLVASLPLDYDNKNVALELAKDITGVLDVNDPIHRNNFDISGIIRELNDAVTKDSFTGLYNKQYISSQLLTEMEQAKKSGSPLSIAVMDVDYFKTVNDTYGHHTGDEVLLKIAELLKELTKDGTCWAGRFGGDEFLITFPGVAIDEANRHCEELVRALTEYRFSCNNQMFGITASIGVKQFNPDEDSFEDYLAHTDAIMYEEKKKVHDRKI